MFFTMSCGTHKETRMTNNKFWKPSKNKPTSIRTYEDDIIESAVKSLPSGEVDRIIASFMSKLPASERVARMRKLDQLRGLQFSA